MRESSGGCVGSKASVEVAPRPSLVLQPQSRVLLGRNTPRFWKAERRGRLACKPWLCHGPP